MLHWILWTYRWQHETLSKTPYFSIMNFHLLHINELHPEVPGWELIFCTGVQGTTVYSNFYCLASLVKWRLYVALHLTGCKDWAGGVHQQAADRAQVVSTALPGALSQGGVRLAFCFSLRIWPLNCSWSRFSELVAPKPLLQTWFLIGLITLSLPPYTFLSSSLCRGIPLTINWVTELLSILT